MTSLRVLDLFSGIVGFSLGLERTGGNAIVPQIAEIIGRAILESVT